MTGFTKFGSVVLPMLIAFAVVWLIGPHMIRFLKARKAQQTERDDGPKSHLGKTGTPNMGGLMILAGLLAGSLVMAPAHPEVIPVLILTVGFGIVGFADDFIKSAKKRSDGLSVKQKMAFQVAIALIYAWYVTHIHQIPLSMKVPFASGMVLDFGRVGNVLLFLFVAVATVNGTNFTDGVDGLSSSVTTAVALFFTVAALLTGSGTASAGAAMIGALLGFLLYNCHPAQIFMGDTGSLALSGFVVGMAYMMQLPLFIPIVGFIYMLEVISVIIQVLYFKKTHGKRFFRMAPIHHHFELGGWSETRVTTTFTVITMILCAAGLTALWW